MLNRTRFSLLFCGPIHRKSNFCNLEKKNVCKICFCVFRRWLSLSLVVVFRLNSLRFLNQTLVSVVYLIFNTLFNYISVTLDKGNE